MRVTKYLLKVSLIALAIFTCGAVPALAFQESTSSAGAPGSAIPTNTTPVYSCPTCHGLESGVTSPTVGQVSVPASPTSNPEAGRNVGSRKGPHSGYTSGTQKCQTCHTIHNAGGNVALLPQSTISATCEICHDGTGGGGVYGVIEYRSGVAPKAQHRLDVASLDGKLTVTVPGGSLTGGSIETTFTGDGGGLTCTDCHNPHNSNTVNAFLGDRKRSIADTSTTLYTNRLLRQRPTRGTTPTAEYGTEWCEACHSGMHSTETTLANHPVAGASSPGGPWNYNRVVVLDGYNTTATAPGTAGLGGSNFGYVMAKSSVAPTRGAQPYPICQQCHEDARDIGGVLGQKSISSTTQAFAVNADGVGGGNPRFQNFPHESQNATFLVETGDDLCLNCH